MTQFHMQNNNQKFQEFIQHYMHVQDVLIIAGGPSQLSFDLTTIHPSKKLLIICCNQSFLQLPQAQIAHHSDYAWWLQYQATLKASFQGDIISGCGLGHNRPYPEHEVLSLKTVRIDTQAELFHSLHYVYGNNCGLQAFSLAHLFQPQRIWLMGYDFQAQQGQTHAYQHQQPQELAHFEKFWGLFLKDFQHFEHLRQRVWHSVHPKHQLPQVFNLNPDSALKLYPSPLELPHWLSLHAT
ncbi:hypothetical protein B9T33_01695 [Acinetobacter sp. ANC 5054]|nr:hypothetical protein B9T33_01695 [Acinetobacter sp. ANC 5054]